MLYPEGIELELPTLRDRATGVLNGLPLSFPRKSRSSGEVPSLPECGESKELEILKKSRSKCQVAVHRCGGERGGGAGRERMRRERER